ncbi:MAG: hypothetical protein KDC35_02435 [Acidobacteria bacterium]|nr:hypothetical protein [Acidobacteriota bacterium]
MSDFYVGYGGSMPSRHKKAVSLFVWVSLVCSLLLAMLWLYHMKPLEESHFEFGITKNFEGELVWEPVPMLRVSRPGSVAVSHYLLVNEGKFGLEKSYQSMAGKQVKVNGSLIYRNGRTMIEVRSCTRTGEGKLQAIPSSDRRVSLVGEIVDSKCYLGVMNPGDKRGHQACAVRCISGGIPPMLMVGNEAYILVGPAGTPLNREILDRIAVPVTVTGIARTQGEWQVLETSPTQITLVR